MIKMHYKKISVALMALGLLSATAVLAESADTTSNRPQMVQDKQDARQEAKTQNVCDRISQFVENLNQKISEQENNIRNRHQERLTNWENNTTEADVNLENLRANWENNRKEQFAKLEMAAKTDDQKKAVSAFEATTNSAIATRAAAVDAAIEAFRIGVKNAIQTRQGQLDAIISGSDSARATALAKVQSDCAAGKDAATVRADFQNGLKGTRTQLQNDKQNMTKVSDGVQALIQVRRTAVEKAMGDFKATMEKARIALKTAFPDQTSDATATK